MSARVFIRRASMPAPAAELFAWHERPGALERLTPPWSPVKVLEREGGLESGRVVLGVPVGPAQVRWVAEHKDYVAGRQFVDEQVSGPFARWRHTHRVEPDGPEASILEDRVEWALPGGAVGDLLGAGATNRLLDRLFAWRHRTTAQDLAAHAPCRSAPARTIAVTGASGLVGRALVPFLTTGGHRVLRIGRRESGPDAAVWNPGRGVFPVAELEGTDAVVHLAGESIASHRWNAEVKREIRESRVQGTRLLAGALASLARPPKVLVCASAIGWYGDRGDAVLDETSASGVGFLADVCGAWEGATEAASRAGIRVVHLRIGVVLTPLGGALAQMLPPARLGLGGPLGSGTQYVSWIGIDDVVGAIHHAIVTDSLSGPVNATAPDPVTSAALAKALGRTLGRPAFLPAPAAALRLALGEMADALLLASTRVVPARLRESGYRFRTPTIDGALAHVLGTG